MNLAARLFLPLLASSLLLSGCDSPSSKESLRQLSRKLEQHQQRTSERVQALSRRLTRLENQEVGASAPILPNAGRGNRPQGTPVAGGSYRLSLATDPPTLDPVRIEDTTSFSVAIQIMEGLLEFDQEMNLIPVLARSWSVSSDQRTYTFELHRGVRFHHGREMTAEDFVYSFGRNLDPEAQGVRTYLFDRILGYPTFSALTRIGRALKRSLQGEDPELEKLTEATEILAKIDPEFLKSRGHPDPEAISRLARELQRWTRQSKNSSLEEAARRSLVAQTEALSVWDFLERGLRAPSPTTFVVELAQPFAPFVWNLPMVNAAVVPREEVERLGNDFAFHPVGTGPFRLSRWDHDVGITLEAFADYFQGRPHLDRIQYRILADPVTRLVEYEVGNLDSLHQIPDEKYQEIRANPPGELIEFPLLHVFYLGMNAHRPPFDDLRVRRAFNHAIHKELILAKIKKGRGVVARGPLPPAFKAYDPDLVGYEYDPEKARRLLAEAGYGPENPLRGVPFWFNTATGSDANAQIAEVVQADLKQVGVELSLQGMAWGTYLDRVHRCEAPLFRLAWLPSHPNGDSLLYAMFRSGSASNATCYENSEVDQFLDQARAENLESKRVELYRAAQRQVVADAAWIPLFHARQEVLHRPWVKNLKLNARGMEAARLRGVWLEK